MTANKSVDTYVSPGADTGAALLLAGILLLLFLDQSWRWVAGFACIGSGIITGAIGLARYRRMSRSISLIRKQFGIDTLSSMGTTRPPRI
jgi:hypothetical protein